MNENTNPPRRLRLFLRDHRVLDASARVPQGQSLATYLASRNRYVNLTTVGWIGTGEQVPHMALKVSSVLWASSEDGDVPLTSGLAAAHARPVEVELEGGYLIAAGLLLAPDQRLTDYLQTAPSFVPLREAELRPRGKELGDLAVNHEAIKVVRELDARAAGRADEQADGKAVDEPPAGAAAGGG
ncbi:MAG: hypothetical protein ACLFRX_04980 [Gemmatimonadota bacterium]